MRRTAIVFVLLLVIAGGWTAAWFAAAQEASRRVDAWIAREAAQHRQWTCPARAIGGYPFALALTCRAPAFAGTALGRSVAAHVAGLTATTRLIDPTTVSIELVPPFAYRSSDGGVDVRGQWTALAIDLHGLPDVARASVVGRDLDAEGVFGPQGQQHLVSHKLDADVALPKGGADPVVGFDIAVGGTDIPQIDALLGDAQPSDLAFAGVLHAADVGDARTPEEAIERWRQAGGEIELTSSRITRGASHATADGTLRLDEAHRPQGRLQAEFVGLDPILKHFGISAHVAGAGAFLSKLFGSGRAPSEPGGIALPVNLQNGRLAVGPLKTDVTLPPLY